jgi:hypothetical protein
VTIIFSKAVFQDRKIKNYHLWNNFLSSELRLILKFKAVASLSPCTVKFHTIPTDSWEKRKENKKRTAEHCPEKQKYRVNHVLPLCFLVTISGLANSQV